MDPLRQMSTGTPLEDARHLAQRYSRMRQEAETQVCDYACKLLWSSLVNSSICLNFLVSATV